MFKLNKTLARDTFEICNLKLCKVLLMNDQNYPWLILVPRIKDITDLHHIPMADQANLMNEISKVSHALEKITSPKKLNVAALGNIVSQLHIHIIARFENDAAWPAPVWGKTPAVLYSSDMSNELVNNLKVELN